jgi:plasmid maintenance system killer protein
VSSKGANKCASECGSESTIGCAASVNRSKSGGNNLFNLKSFNELKKDQTNLKIFKNSSFDSSFNSVQSLNINLSQIIPPLEPASNSIGGSPCLQKPQDVSGKSLSCEAGLLNRKNIKQKDKNLTHNNIISKNLLLVNMKYKFLKSTLSSILKKKIRSISDILEDKPIKNYVIYSYLKNCISLPSLLRRRTLARQEGTPPHLKGGIAKLSLNKYKGRKFGRFIYYNKIIEYKFNSTFNPLQKLELLQQQEQRAAVLRQANKENALASVRGARVKELKGLDKNRGNIKIKDTYKLLFYLFKSMYCLISKPVLKYSNDKVTIQLFYYLNIPKKKVFRLFAISYINSIKKKWFALIEKKKTNFMRSNPSFIPLSSSLNGGVINKATCSLRTSYSKGVLRSNAVQWTSLPKAGANQHLLLDPSQL